MAGKSLNVKLKMRIKKMPEANSGSEMATIVVRETILSTQVSLFKPAIVPMRSEMGMTKSEAQAASKREFRERSKRRSAILHPVILREMPKSPFKTPEIHRT
jgi:hypothetical protein